MKKTVFNLLIVTVLSAVALNCKNKVDEAQTSAAVEKADAAVTSLNYKANTTESVIEWKGFKPTGSHHGTINIESGTFTVKDGKIDSGSFLIDMKSIVNLDMEPSNKYNARLVNHLKSDDFFDVEKYPHAAFEVTAIEEQEGKLMLSGNLTMKEQKNNITFPVSIASEGDDFILTSEAFTIDRSKWNVKFKSKSFFSDLGDDFINDDIELKMILKGKKS